MTESQTTLERARHGVQELHKKICGNIAKAEEASWADVAAVQADAVKSGLKAALITRDAAGTLVGGTRVAPAAPAKDGVKHAHAARLDIAISLRRAIAAARTGRGLRAIFGSASCQASARVLRAPRPLPAIKKDIIMKTLSLLIATTSLAIAAACGAPALAETAKKTTLTLVDPNTLITAWRASDIIGTMIYDDDGVSIGKVKDMLVAANGSVPFVIITNIPGDDEASRNVVVSASDFELVGKKLTMHGGSAAVLMGAPVF